MLVKKYILPLTILVIVFGLPYLLMLKGQTSKEIPASKQKQLKDILAEVKDEYPSVEYSNEVVMDEKRKTKSEKYNKLKVIYPDIDADNQVVSNLDWATGLSPLPVKESQVVLIGKVVDAQAYLSSTKTAVYSEFKLEVEKVLKQEGQQIFEEDKFLRVEREGGIVQFPSGYQTLYIVDGQRMPKIEHRYIFFLTHKFPLLGYSKEDYHLLTAYELKEEKVFPLDNPGGGTHPIAIFYKGKEESFLLKNLQNAINDLKTPNKN